MCMGRYVIEELREMSVHLDSHIDNSYEKLIPLHVCCGEKRVRQAVNYTVHQQYDLFRTWDE